ncbi:unnamed protein product [Bursaphelenchus xylophilus]|uniref:(pine wood nematode) hypothetical protein n=1 Tax=Bursaphelenchus xylophilus TaxID=6326 RepID=A0A1I7S6D9_BURXY|nr:unnamed protein product [Bursaphelenchus xylophilus]CAG9128096.1 unnamed protein product [Bursaphelenchus xylophilus]
MALTKQALSYLLNDTDMKLSNFVGNKFVPPADGAYLDSVDPSTGKRWLRVPDSSRVDVEDAIEAASKAFEDWSNTSAEHRSSLMNKLADIVEQNIDEYAKVESRDQGKPITLARTMDIPRVVHNFRFFAAAIRTQTNPSHIMQERYHTVSFVKNDPVGVAALICPWNLPVYLLIFKLAPALACGNTVVCKPSEVTSASAWVLMHSLVDAGFPSGVVNMVIGTGPGVGDPLITSEKVPLISFTGSTGVGKMINTKAAPLNKKISLEMGGKNAAVIFADVNMETVLPGLVRSCFTNQGEVCLCTSRIFVQRAIYKNFLEKFAALAKELKVGCPTDPSTNIGALVSKAHYEKVASYIALAEKEGLQINCGGIARLNGPLTGGYFIAPTVISGLSDDCRLMREEIFGPVVVVAPFETAEEVVKRVNASEYGLSATVWSDSIDNVTFVANRVRVGTVWCNCWLVRDLTMPFGGTKQSGLGREGLEDSIHFYTEQKNVCIKLS